MTMSKCRTDKTVQTCRLNNSTLRMNTMEAKNESMFYNTAIFEEVVTIRGVGGLLLLQPLWLRSCPQKESRMSALTLLEVRLQSIL